MSLRTRQGCFEVTDEPRETAFPAVRHRRAACVFASLGFALCLCAQAFAQSSSTAVSPYADSKGRFLPPPGELPVDWLGTRALGMGGAFTSIANDELAPFTNPAGLARTRNPRSRDGVHEVAFPGTAIGANAGALAKAQGGSLGEWTTRTVDAARSDPGGAPRILEAQAYPFVTFGGKNSPTWLVGFPMRSSLVTRSANDAGTNRTLVFSETTATTALGIAGSTRASLFAWGLSVRPNYRTSFVDTDYARTRAALGAIKSDALAKGVRTTGIGIDAGVLVTAADFWFPTFGLAVRNIPTGCAEGYVNPANGKSVTMCGTLRTKSKGSAPKDTTTGEPIVLPGTLVDPTELRAGFSITPRGRFDGNKVNLRLAVDAYPIPVETGGKSYGITDTGLDQLVHVGAELFFGNAILGHGLALRGGYQDSNPTFGFTASLAGIQIEGAHYAVKTGLGSQQRYDQRSLLGLTTDW